MNLRWVKIYWVPPWDEDCREYGCPIQVMIHTRKYNYLWRPFSKSQAYDWKKNKYTGSQSKNFNDIVWKHWVKSPQRPEIWERL